MGISEILGEIRVMRRHPLDMLILFVTGQCNSKCRHCFYWKRIGPRHKGLPLERIEKLSRSMPSFRTLLLSGGEPTLRSDLPQIVETFRVNNCIRAVSVPTNGLLPDHVSGIATELAALDPHLLVSLNVSIDGLAETHDHIRGQAGSYVAAVRTLERLRQVSAGHPNLRVYVNTVICGENYAEVLCLARCLRSTGLIDGHFFELVRGEPRDEQLKAIPPEALRSLHRELVALQEAYLAQEAWRTRRGLLGLWRRFTDVGNLVNRYRHQWRVYVSVPGWGSDWRHRPRRASRYLRAPRPERGPGGFR